MMMTTNLDRSTVLNNLWRTTVGFEDFFRELETRSRTPKLKLNNFPPYDIIRREDENVTQVRVALAGYAKDDIEVLQDGDVLTVRSRVLEPTDKDDKEETTDVVQYQGISQKKFELSFSLARGNEVTNANFENGMLLIDVQKNQEDSVKRIEIK